MRKFAIIFFMFLFPFYVSASTPDVLGKFFEPDGIKNKRAVYHGEMFKHYVDKLTMGETLPKGTQIEIRLLNKGNEDAVYAVLLRQSEQVQDWYAYLRKEEGIWKLSAIRNLAKMGLIYMAINELNGASARDEEEWHLQNMLLTIKSDAELKLYLKDNFDKFNKIAEWYSKGEESEAKKIAKNIFVKIRNKENGIISLLVGGILDNSVGYLFVPKGKQPPKMSPDDYIYVEEVVDGWYVYKTT